MDFRRKKFLKLTNEAQNMFLEAKKSPDFAGYMEKLSKKNNTWKKSWFTLKEGYLFYCKNSESNPQGIINIHGSAVKKEERPNCFSLYSQSSVSTSGKWRHRTYILASKEVEPWMQKLEEASERVTEKTKETKKTKKPESELTLKELSKEEEATQSGIVRISNFGVSKDSQMDSVRISELEIELSQVKAELSASQAALAKLQQENVTLKESNRKAKQNKKIEEITRENEKLNDEIRKLKENVPDAFDVQLLSADNLDAAEEKFYQLLKVVRDKKKEIRTCPVCLDKLNDTVFGCGHMSCSDCASALSNCPTCRTDIVQKSRVYI